MPMRRTTCQTPLSPSPRKTLIGSTALSRAAPHCERNPLPSSNRPGATFLLVPRSFVFATVCTALAISPVLWGQAPSQKTQSLVQKAKVRQACAEAVRLHADQKPTQALAKIKAALAFDPKNPVLLNYRAELEAASVNEELDQHALRAPAAAEKS